MTEIGPSTTAMRSIVRRRPPSVLRRVLRDPLAITALVVLVVFFLASLFAPLLAPYPPNATDLSSVLVGPSAAHPLGTDGAGRDVLSRLLVGGRLTFLAAVIVVAWSMVVGVPTGLVAGFYGRIFDTTSSWVSDMLLALPTIIILLAARAAFGPSIWVSMTVLGIMFSPSFYRLVRTSVRSVRSELYVDAARVSGLSDVRIIGRHIFGVVRAPLVLQAAQVAGIAIAVQAGLEFLGLGDYSTPSWGAMLNEGFRNVYLSPLALLWPALAISLVTASLAIVANSVRDTLQGTAAPRRAARVGSARTAKSAATVTDAERAADADAAGHLLSVENLTIEYPLPDGDRRRVVDSVSLHVDRGEVVGVVGESGSGKTQTAFAILDLLPGEAEIVSGSIWFDGTQRFGSGQATGSRRDLLGTGIAYVPQEPMSNLDPNFRIGSQLTRPLVKRLGLSRAEARARALELLATVGIPEPERVFRSYPHQISGGMAQRVLIAGAVSMRPALLIADEPTTALDVTVQAEVLDLLRGLQAELGMGVLLVTHNFGVVSDLCDRVIVMEKSRIVEVGAVRTVLRTPQSPYTKRLLASTLEGKPRRMPLLDETGEVR
jgi:ABC-type dipeptide/oligopeptide/nickel transport system ATPase component/ABC-type dipeptide/oligopeptide/nickel transport system permease subunit